MPQLRVSAGWAVDDQPVSRVPREDLTHGDGEFWSVADGGRVLVPHSRQAFGTAALEIADFLWTATAYRRVVDDQTMFAPRLFPGTIADVAGTFLHHGSTTATGFEMLIERKTRWNTARASYAWRRVVDTFPTLEADTFPDSHVQANEFKIADSARPGRGWSLGAAWVIASGRPTTPADGVHPVWFPSGSTVDAITFGPKNSDQLPAYDRLDLSAERAFRFRALTTTLGVDLLNAYDRQNVAYREYEIVAGSMAATDVPLMRRVVDAHIKLAF